MDIKSEILIALMTGTLNGLFILVGTMLFLLSLFFSFEAGRLKENLLVNTGTANPLQKSSVRKGMLLAITGCVLSGLLSLAMNMGWAKEIIDTAVDKGNASLSYAGNAVLFLMENGNLLTRRR